VKTITEEGSTLMRRRWSIYEKKMRPTLIKRRYDTNENKMQPTLIKISPRPGETPPQTPWGCLYS
jgi:hypothetical protein